MAITMPMFSAMTAVTAGHSSHVKSALWVQPALHTAQSGDPGSWPSAHRFHSTPPLQNVPAPGHFSMHRRGTPLSPCVRTGLYLGQRFRSYRRCENELATSLSSAAPLIDTPCNDRAAVADVFAGVVAARKMSASLT